MTGFVRAEYDINGVKTVVHSIGNGPELVFLHGTGTFTGFEAARGWAAHHKVIIPFHPGFGESGDADGLDTIDDYVLHYMDVFERLGLTTFDLAGFSLGGWMAAEFAIRQPQRINRLVLIAPAGLVVEHAPAPDLFQIQPQELPSYLAHDPAAALRYFPKAPDPDFNARLGREVGGYARLIRDNPQGNPKLAQWIHRITVPTLVLWGAEDRMRPTAQGDAWMAGLPDGVLELVPATGHLVLEETPSAGRLVSDFLAGRAGFRRTEREEKMVEMPAGITAADQGFENVVWSILGQTYTLKQHSTASMAWHAVFPAGTFVPPHVHPTQDEFIYVLSGRYDLWLDGKESVAGPGDLIRLPKGVPHGIFNKSGETATSLFWVAPTRSLKELFERIHNLPDPQEVVRIAAEHEVNFLPPPA
jgi:pimeloyl-ACP methyl ester carboxylesterase/quercetin dioxygenase-like cupin family protein